MTTKARIKKLEEQAAKSAGNQYTCVVVWDEDPGQIQPGDIVINWDDSPEPAQQAQQQHPAGYVDYREVLRKIDPGRP